MLTHPNASTLLNEHDLNEHDLTEAIESEDYGVTLPLGTGTVQQPSVTKPSDVDMESLSQDGQLGMEDDKGPYEADISDENMSDGGGAALTLTLSHAEQLNAELDILDAELMGSENLAELLYHPTMDQSFNYYESIPGQHMNQESDSYDEDIMEEEVGPGPIPVPPPVNISPVALSAVSQQLQHIQDGQGQEHANLTAAADALHGGFQDNSISPILFHPFLSMNFGHAGEFEHMGFVSLADITSQQQPVNLGLPNTPQLLGNTSILVSAQGHSTVSHFPSDMPELEDDQITDADDDAVDDQFNLSFAEFLYNWAHSSSREEDVKRRPQGPKIHAVESQRDVTNAGPMTRSQLNGEKCDIQRINWAELGVLRLEARQMRRQTYKNYTNLRIPPQWHVSIRHHLRFRCRFILISFSHV